MKIEVKGQVFPKAWEIARSVKKLREERRAFNIGSGTVEVPIYEVSLPEGTTRDGAYFITPQGVRLYLQNLNHYGLGYLISELDDDPIARRHFT
ncbi:MAG: hypothetical protein QXX77_09905 [Candidatus Methanosuratincola sp.]